MIVKVQVPLAGSLANDESPLMVYPKSRWPFWQLWPTDMDPADLARIRADCAETGKAYYNAAIKRPRAGGRVPKIGERVEDQQW